MSQFEMQIFLLLLVSMVHDVCGSDAFMTLFDELECPSMSYGDDSTASAFNFTPSATDYDDSTHHCVQTLPLLARSVQVTQLGVGCAGKRCSTMITVHVANRSSHGVLEYLLRYKCNRSTPEPMHRHRWRHHTIFERRSLLSVWLRTGSWPFILQFCGPRTYHIRSSVLYPYYLRAYQCSRPRQLRRPRRET